MKYLIASTLLLAGNAFAETSAPVIPMPTLRVIDRPAIIETQKGDPVMRDVLYNCVRVTPIVCAFPASSLEHRNGDVMVKPQETAYLWIRGVIYPVSSRLPVNLTESFSSKSGEVADDLAIRIVRKS